MARVPSERGGTRGDSVCSPPILCLSQRATGHLDIEDAIHGQENVRMRWPRHRVGLMGRWGETLRTPGSCVLPLPGSATLGESPAFSEPHLGLPGRLVAGTERRMTRMFLAQWGSSTSGFSP